jgi:protein-S-isoprenylcysteine O-methyltransferase Ste14
MDSAGVQCCRHFFGWRRIPKKGGSPKGESVVHTTVVVDSGVYAVVRHPQYLGFMLFVFALLLMAQHWLSVVSAVLGATLFYRDVLREEQISVGKFGDDYKRYMERLPRMNLLIGILRYLRQRRKAVSGACINLRNNQPISLFVWKCL